MGSLYLGVLRCFPLMGLSVSNTTKRERERDRERERERERVINLGGEQEMKE